MNSNEQYTLSAPVIIVFTMNSNKHRVSAARIMNECLRLTFIGSNNDYPSHQFEQQWLPFSPVRTTMTNLPTSLNNNDYPSPQFEQQWLPFYPVWTTIITLLTSLNNNDYPSHQFEQHWLPFSPVWTTMITAPGLLYFTVALLLTRIDFNPSIDK